MTINGVIETSSGDLLRAGFVNFSSEPTFNGGTETYKTDVPHPPKCRDGRDENGSVYATKHNWTGSAWQEIAQ